MTAPRRHESDFLSTEEGVLADAFLRQGHVIVPVADLAALRRLREAMAGFAAEHLGVSTPGDAGAFMDAIHGLVAPERLNALRLKVIDGVNRLSWARRCYFELARPALEIIVGNELAMQRRLNLSIQLPGDHSSLLPVHADVWDGDSPFEVVAWLPLVDCRRSKSMYLLPPPQGAAWEARMAEFDGHSTEDLFRAIEPEVVWLDVPFGHMLLSSQNLMHGNRVNRENETRWSMNCRFKSLFSPYAEKRLGEFFEPISMRPATRIGLGYRLPGGFVE
ncbi:MAG: hypothetical protein FJX68_12285 [Alphaproteobacteria bacterium]|nr:hypothetical protein [Alphaproteobacteria bacterium]